MVSKSYLTRDQILNADDIKKRAVKVPEWGGQVLVYGMTGREREELEEIVNAYRGRAPEDAYHYLRAKIVSFCIKDESGMPLFSEDDIIALGKKSAAALLRVSDVARELSALSDADVDSLVKNSKSDRSEDSPTD